MWMELRAWQTSASTSQESCMEATDCSRGRMRGSSWSEWSYLYNTIVVLRAWIQLNLLCVLEHLQGGTCGIDLNSCRFNPCANGGTCQNLPNDHICICTPGFTDFDCSVEFAGCEPNPCVHGNCTAPHPYFSSIMLLAWACLIFPNFCW